MDAEFKLQSKLENDCLVLKTFGYVNNVGGEQIAKEFRKTELSLSLCLEQHIDEEMQRAILTLESMRHLKPVLRYMSLEGCEK